MNGQQTQQGDHHLSAEIVEPVEADIKGLEADVLTLLSAAMTTHMVFFMGRQMIDRHVAKKIRALMSPILNDVKPGGRDRLSCPVLRSDTLRSKTGGPLLLLSLGLVPPPAAGACFPSHHGNDRAGNAGRDKPMACDVLQPEKDKAMLTRASPARLVAARRERG